MTTSGDRDMPAECERGVATRDSRCLFLIGSVPVLFVDSIVVLTLSPTPPPPASALLFSSRLSYTYCIYTYLASLHPSSSTIFIFIMPFGGGLTSRPRTSVPRPPLPTENANPHLQAGQSYFNSILSHPIGDLTIRTYSIVDASRPPPVKFQEIIRDGQATIVSSHSLTFCTIHGFTLVLSRLAVSKSRRYAFHSLPLPLLLNQTKTHLYSPAQRARFHPSSPRYGRNLPHHYVPRFLPLRLR